MTRRNNQLAVNASSRMNRIYSGLAMSQSDARANTSLWVRRKTNRHAALALSPQAAVSVGVTVARTGAMTSIRATVATSPADV
jgi:hypothetical protein